MASAPIPTAKASWPCSSWRFRALSTATRSFFLSPGIFPGSRTTYSSKYRIFSSSRSDMSRSWPMREGRPLKNHTCETGEASSMWPIRSRRTRALVVLGGPEDAGAEEAVPLGLERPVVDGLRLLDLAVRPVADLLRRRQLDTDGAERHGLRVPIENPPQVLRGLLFPNQAAECPIRQHSVDLL